MSQYNNTGVWTGTNGGTAIARALRVKFSTGTLAVAGVERSIGVTRNRVEANEPGSVFLPTKPGTVPMTASAAISQGAAVYGAAGGKISGTKGVGAFLEGFAMEAAGADGDIIEVLPVFGETAGT